MYDTHTHTNLITFSQNPFLEKLLNDNLPILTYKFSRCFIFFFFFFSRNLFYHSLRIHAPTPSMDKRRRKQPKTHHCCCSEEVSSIEWEFINMTEQEEDLICRMYKLVGDRWVVQMGIDSWANSGPESRRNRKVLVDETWRGICQQTERVKQGI
ncbi:hypothetical protein F0562_015001 [Nyssa sinensis]|uniref:Myb-like domain-containing protein n=1 Tax=Nyssa sinensis TaxID=561372 RepID=A0A5J4ZU89_9ASTE|nr:hypothetical protein F0562_015001 [Nyssa sinensis]